MAQRYQNRVSGDTGDINLSQLVKVVFYCESSFFAFEITKYFGGDTLSPSDAQFLPSRFLPLLFNMLLSFSFRHVFTL